MRWSNVLRIALVVVFVLILGLVIKSYVSHRTGARNLMKAVDTLQQDNPRLRLIDSALVKLYEAEINFRFYTAVYEQAFLEIFSKQLDTVSGLLDSVNRPRPADSPRQLDSLIEKKAVMSDKLADLKKSTDEMLARSLKNEIIDSILRSVPPYKASRFKKEEVVTDTAKAETAPIAKKGLFKRLGQAIANKQDTLKSKQTITVKTKTGEVITLEEFEARQTQRMLSDVNGYYKNILRQQLEGRSRINVTEHSLAGTNLSLLEDLKVLIRRLKVQAEAEEAQRKYRAGLDADSSVGTMKFYFTLCLLLLAAVICLLIWYIADKHAKALKEEKLRAEENARARSVFLANMSHEIRTPLNSIIGFSEQLAHTPLEKNQQELLQAVEVSADMLMQVVNDVLDFSKLESDYISIQQQPFGLHNAIADVVSTMRIQATRKKLDFRFTFEGDEQQHVLGDAFRLKQILVNLIGNAIKYTETGSVTVTAKLEKQPGHKARLTFAVEDTGPGINAETLPMIFERYYQARSPRMDIKGTGLGLAITKRLVDMHKGEISVTSEVNKGTRFTCQIPYETVGTPQTVVITQQDLELMNDRQLEGMYVLVADDQEMNLLLLKMILNRWKCRFDMARDGQSAYELFKTNKYDLVLLDMQMPRMSGLEVIQHIRADKDAQKAKVPVFALTADITMQDEEAFRKAGFTAWLLKPFRERDIYKVITSHLPKNRIEA